MADLFAYFEIWARGALDDYPTICEGEDSERVCIRAGEARRLLERAYRAGWECRDTGPKNPETRL